VSGSVLAFEFDGYLLFFSKPKRNKTKSRETVPGWSLPSIKCYLASESARALMGGIAFFLRDGEESFRSIGFPVMIHPGPAISSHAARGNRDRSIRLQACLFVVSEKETP